MGNRRIEGQVRCVSSGPGRMEYLKELNARKLYELMDKIGISMEVQEMLVTGRYTLENIRIKEVK